MQSVIYTYIYIYVRMYIYIYIYIYIYSIFVQRASRCHTGLTRASRFKNTSKTHKNTYKSPHLLTLSSKVAQTQKPTKTRVFRKSGFKNTQKYVCFASERLRPRKYENTQKHVCFDAWTLGRFEKHTKTHAFSHIGKNTQKHVFSGFQHLWAPPGSPGQPK